LDIEQNDLRAQLTRSHERRRAIFGFADYVKPFGFQWGSCDGPEAGMVVDNEHRETHGEILACRGRPSHQGQPSYLEQAPPRAATSPARELLAC
jgi:hypothetical protein